MIDLTLDSILIPDITGYTPPFGTKVVRTAVNKGGLSTQEVNNNIIASFVKMRGVVVDETDTTTSVVEYDAKIIIEATTAITLTLGNGGYRGCRVTIANNTEFTHTLSCTSVSTNTPHILPYAECEIVWTGSAWKAVGGVRVGQTYQQEPQTDSPFDVFPCSDWVELISHNGTFKRAANAPTTLYTLDAERWYADAELTHPVEWRGIMVDDGSGGYKAGSVTDTGDTATNSKGQTVRIYAGDWTAGNADDWIEKSGELKQQKAQLPDITGRAAGTNGVNLSGAFSIEGGGMRRDYWWSDSRGPTISGWGNIPQMFRASRAGASTDANGENVYTANGETRPSNFTHRIWRRTA